MIRYLDCATGVDDALAPALSPATPDVQFAGIGAVSGNTSARQGAVDPLGVLALAGRADVPVAVGAHEPGPDPCAPLTRFLRVGTGAVPDAAGRPHRPLLTCQFDERTPKGSETTMNSVYDSMARQGLIRPRSGRILGGVCAGLGRRFGLDPWIARMLFVLILFVIPGSQILIYPVLWVLMPSEERAFSTTYPPMA